MYSLANVGAPTVNVTELLETPPTDTMTDPVVAPVGTLVWILVFDQLVTAAVVPLNVTVLDPCVAPKAEPLIVTAVATGPDVGVRLVICGAWVKVNVLPLLARKPTVTMTLPVVAPDGTVV